MRLLRLTLMAATFAPLTAAAQTPHADAPTLSVEARAQDLYVSGRDRFRAADFPGAIEDFRRSLDLVDSPNTRMYLGRALRRLGRLPEAFATLDRAASDADRRAVTEPRYAATRESARAEAGELRGDIALLTIHVAGLPPGAAVRAAGSEVPATAIGYPMPFAPGEVVVEFDAPGYAPARQILILTAGGDAAVELTPRVDASLAATPGSARLRPTQADGTALRLRPTDPAPARPWATTRVLGVTALSAGVATVITGVVFGALAWSDYETLSAQEAGSRDPARTVRGEFHRDLANVLIASGSVLGVTGLVLFWLGSRASTDAQRPPLQVDVGFNAAGPTFGLRGTL
ncbi:MAG: hypothetical protein Q8S73_24905 [Deltaproteobacteria bacterium]|nr:hypothetical protein [Myxococcales bacterium]MDP3217375.1 hypothetical protein [Deltaproteobacteria bacterium]